MHSEKTERLFQEFPELFHKEQLRYGFECQDGWFVLIHRLACQITEYQSRCPALKNLQVIEVKQKMGVLRFSALGCDEVIERLIHEAELESQSICELDGEPATGLYACAPHWMRYLCTTCAKLHEYMTIKDYLGEKPKVIPLHQQIHQSEQPASI